MDDRVFILLLALALDGLIGDPAWAWRRAPHPVVLMGRTIDWLDRRLNDPRRKPMLRRILGVVAALIVPAGFAGLGAIAAANLAEESFGWAAEALLASIFIAQRSLYDHVAAVARGLEQDGLAGGRAAVAHIVGRDPNSLDEAGVARAAIESLAENFSDGATAPIFWYLVGGLPGLLAYKAINTADSMVGHRTERHRDYGWASARIDDVANLIPARLAGLIMTLAAGLRMKSAFMAMLRDATRHTSPNAGWPEAAMAGALGLALAGPRVYKEKIVQAAFMNEGGRTQATASDVRAALRLFVVACLVQMGLIWISS